MVWERIQKVASLKQLPTRFKAKREKGVGTAFPPHYTPGYDSLVVHHACTNVTKTLLFAC